MDLGGRATQEAKAEAGMTAMEGGNAIGLSGTILAQ